MKKCLVLILSVIAAFAAAISLTACGKVDFTVKFSVDGEAYASVSTGGSEVIKMPADPQKDGYTFDGWFWDDGVWARPFTANSLLNEPLKSDMTVYAKFSENNVEVEVRSKSLTVTGNEIKGKVANAQTTFSFINDIEVADGANYAVYSDLACVQPVPSKTIGLIDGDNVCYILVTNGNDINLYTVTVRRRPIYTVAFDTSGGTSIDSQQVEEDSLAAKPDDPEKTGYDFSGFDYDFSKPIVENTTINAKWQIITYKISYVLNGGVNKVDNPTTYTVEDNIELKPASDKLGYTFRSWDNGGVIEKGSTGDKTFTANWQVITYKISYVLNGGVNDAENPTTYTIEDKIELRPATKTGYTFTSWDNGGVIGKGSTGDKTFTANWQVITYKISYVLNGGINDVQNPITYTVEDKIELKSAIKTGYSCKWNNSGVIKKGSTGDKTFTADYTPITYKITYNCGLGENNANNVTTYNIESDTIKLLDPYYINADFVEWQRGGVKITEIPTGTYGDITLTAVWSEYDVKLKLNDDGESYTVIGLNTDKTDIKIKPTYHGKPVTSIGNGAFEGCESLTSVTIGDSVTSIGSEAFYRCTSLTSVTIPDSVASIGKGAFSGCSGLREITIPFVGDEAGKTASDKYQYPFGYMFGTNSYNGGIATKQYYYGSSTSSTTYVTFFIPSSLKKVTVTGGNILYGAFYGCRSLESITIDDGVTSIGDSAFYGCSGLREITIPFVGDEAGKTASDTYQYPFGYVFGTNSYDGGIATKQYYYGSSTSSTTSTTYYIPSSLKKVSVTGGNILYGAFYGCRSLESITIDDGVTSIGDYAFRDCRLLSSITIGDSVTSIGDWAFSECSSLTSITIGNSVTSIGNSAFYSCTSLTSITVNANNKNYKSIDGNLYSKDGKTLIQYAIGKTDTSFSIPDSVTSIGYKAFSGCTSLTSVTIPDNVTSIGGGAFGNCTSLTSITIPDSVTSIGECAFV